mmetsp:Transcript_86839/g.225585  ORF Transcript_86839/g.225585 Transcript_86839/m.225585 type:complete len:238 (+) Transcript_86839:807-1520(+)
MVGSLLAARPLGPGAIITHPVECQLCRVSGLLAICEPSPSFADLALLVAQPRRVRQLPDVSLLLEAPQLLLLVLQGAARVLGGGHLGGVVAAQAFDALDRALGLQGLGQLGAAPVRRQHTAGLRDRGRAAVELLRPRAAPPEAPLRPVDLLGQEALHGEVLGVLSPAVRLIEEILERIPLRRLLLLLRDRLPCKAPKVSGSLVPVGRSGPLPVGECLQQHVLPHAPCREPGHASSSP